MIEESADREATVFPYRYPDSLRLIAPGFLINLTRVSETNPEFAVEGTEAGARNDTP
jgi:hypothetical protein